VKWAGTQGVTLIALDAKAQLIQVQPVVEADDDELPPTELPPAEDGGADTAAE
jgi:hypothetical protein